MEQLSIVRLQIWSVLTITWYLHLENWKIPYGTDLGHFWGTDPFWGTKLWGLITMEPDVHNVMFAIWQACTVYWCLKWGSVKISKFCPKLGIWEWGNFQPFRFKFGLCTWFLDICTGKILETYLGTDLGPFWGNDPFWGRKIRRSHNYGTCVSIYLKFGRFLLQNDV